MPISGLSNQWKTREGLLEGLAPPSACIKAKWKRIRQLLEALDARPGPTIYVGTSHSYMNFSNRDVIRYGDRTQPFAFVDVVESRANLEDVFIRVKTRKIVGIRPTTDWLEQDFTDVETVVDLLLEAFSWADIPPRRGRDENLKEL